MNLIQILPSYLTSISIHLLLGLPLVILNSSFFDQLFSSIFYILLHTISIVNLILLYSIILLAEEHEVWSHSFRKFLWPLHLSGMDRSTRSLRSRQHSSPDNWAPQISSLRQGLQVTCILTYHNTLTWSSAFWLLYLGIRKAYLDVSTIEELL
jgi:hypothetical protein